jgi:hypothetical protein
MCLKRKSGQRDSQDNATLIRKHPQRQRLDRLWHPRPWTRQHQGRWHRPTSFQLRGYPAARYTAVWRNAYDLLDSTREACGCATKAGSWPGKYPGRAEQEISTRLVVQSNPKGGCT